MVNLRPRVPSLDVGGFVDGPEVAAAVAVAVALVAAVVAELELDTVREVNMTFRLELLSSFLRSEVTEATVGTELAFAKVTDMSVWIDPLLKELTSTILNANP